MAKPYLNIPRVPNNMLEGAYLYAPTMGDATMRALGISDREAALTRQRGLLSADATPAATPAAAPATAPRSATSRRPAQPTQQQERGSGLGALFQDPAFLESLALGFNSMRLNPDQNLAQAIGQRQELRRAKAQTNRTLEYLRQQGRGDLADAVESGALDARTAAAELFRKPEVPEATAMQRNYEFLVGQGMTPEQALGAVRSGTTVNMLGDQMPGLGKLSTDFTYIMDPTTGKPTIDPETGLPRAVPVPGSKADAEAQMLATKAGERARQQELKMGTTLENLSLNIDDIESGKAVLGVSGAALRQVPGSGAANFSARTKQITTRAALDEVQNMRDNSPTGGAVGSLTDGERIALGEAATSLSNSISPDEYRKAAIRFRSLMLDTAHGAGNWSIDDYGRVYLKTLNGVVPETPQSGNMDRDRALRLLTGE